MATSRPPYYILVALNSTSQPPSSTNLRHPAIQYHYTDDSPLSLLPRNSDEHVLILNHGQDGDATVHSISQEFITTGLKIEDAPGAAAVASSQDNIDGRDDRMYIIATTRDDRPATPIHEERKANVILSQFKARNEMIRHALNYPSVADSSIRPAPTQYPYSPTGPSV